METFTLDQNRGLLTRRQVIVLGAGAGALGAMTLTTEGCNASQWIQTALNDLPAILSAVEAILQIVAAATGSADPAAVALAQKLGAEAKNDLTLAQTLINDYKTSASDTTLQKIDSALLDAQSNLAGIEGALHITNLATQAALSAGVSAALVIVVALQTIIPPPATPVPAPASAAVAAAHANRRAAHAAAVKNDSSLVVKLAFNEALTAAGAAQYAIR